MATSNIDPTIPLRVESPDVFGRLSTALTAKRQSQEVKQGAIDLSERQAVQKMLSTGQDDAGQSILGEDGDPDPQKLVPAITRIAPTTGQQYIQAVQTTHANKIQLQRATGMLAGENRDALSGIVRSAINNPDAKAADVSAALDAYGEQNPSAVPAIHYAQKLLSHVDGVQDPKQKAAFLNRLAVELQPAATTSAQQQPAVQGINTGQQVVLANTNPQAPGGVQTVGGLNTTLAPGAQETVQTDQLGNKYVEIRDSKTGRVIGTKDVPSGSNDGGGKGPAHFGAGERQALESQANTNFTNVSNNRTAASLAPQQVDQINKALDISKQTSTGGDLTSTRARLESAVASLVPGLSSVQDDATKLQLLDKFSERIAADSARVLGANASTDAARESIHRQNANIGYTPDAIRSVLKYAKAQTMAMQAKGDAQERWLKQESHGITNQHEFETQWRQSYDPLIFQLEVADPAERAAIVKQMAPEQAADVMRKRSALKELGALKRDSAEALGSK